MINEYTDKKGERRRKSTGITGLAMRSHLGRESMYKMLSATGNSKLSSFTKVIQGLGLRLKVEQDPDHATI